MPLTSWTPRSAPKPPFLVGRYARLELLSWRDHGAGLASILTGPENDDIWRYMPIGPFEARDDFMAVMDKAIESGKWVTLVIRDAVSYDILGMASYMRIRPEHGSLEVGCVAFSKALQRTRTATEAMYLMADHIFTDLGYRRFEWKCHSGNIASKRAAERLGFSYEGTFRQDMVVKGKNRDTAWYSILDDEWPPLKLAFAEWLNSINFDATGQQKAKLQSFFK